MERFSHGLNLIGQHVDAILIDNESYPVFVRAATKEEIEEHCDYKK